MLPILVLLRPVLQRRSGECEDVPGLGRRIVTCRVTPDSAHDDQIIVLTKNVLLS
jgi:hypothetical protein